MQINTSRPLLQSLTSRRNWIFVNIQDPPPEYIHWACSCCSCPTGRAKKDEESAAQVRPALLSLVKGCTAFDPNERFRDPEALVEAVRRRTGIKKRLLSLLITVAAACLAGIVFFLSWQKGIERGHAEGERSGYTPGFSEGFQQGFSDAPGISIHGGSPENNSGNLPGNYSPEGGAFAVSDGNAVYYISGDRISLMDPYTKDVEILAEVPGVYDLQYYDGEALFLRRRKGRLSGSRDPKGKALSAVPRAEGSISLKTISTSMTMKEPVTSTASIPHRRR